MRRAEVAGAGVPLRTYAAGERGRRGVVVASACGMPAQLCEPWMSFLARDRHVVTWETRGMSRELVDAAAFDALDHDVGAQAADLVAVMDAHDLTGVHVMGLCGGAAIALRAAAEHPGRIASLSLWHGDYELGPDGPKTGHQRNLEALMAIARASRSDAAELNAALAGSATATVPAGVADLVAYPYSDPELFYRYCVLTGAIMATDVRPLLGAVGQPSLVVTSEDDDTAHPEGSHRVAAALPAGVLHVEPHGDHISVFAAGQPLRHLLGEFLAEPAAVRV